MYTEKDVFAKKYVNKWGKHGSPLRAWVVKIVYKVKPHWPSGKQKVLDATVCKDGRTDSLLKRPITIDYLEKDASLKSTS